jgi:hypothetical protein
MHELRITRYIDARPAKVRDVEGFEQGWMAGADLLARQAEANATVEG